MRRAVIDVGSGSVVLIVGEQSDEGWQIIRSDSVSTFLGEGAKQTGILSEAAITRTLETIKRHFAIASELDAPVTAAGTMALRIATNRQEFLSRAATQGTPVGVLSAENEAQLGFLAVAEDPTFREHNRIAIVDPGGQSTELVVAERNGAEWDFEHRQSYPIGTLQLRGGRLAAETPEISDLFMATVELDETIGIVPRIGEGATIALGAPGTDLITLREKYQTWEPGLIHGAYLDYEEVGKAVGWLTRMDDAGRKSTGPIEPGRERTIHAGTLILERFLNALAAPGCYVSIRGWRNALLDHPDISLEW
jgi:exopolyphosphatase / guanosine-5'-triphosphate,3'-diphosphate pyrophosphatase